MAIQFPNSPTTGDTFTGSNGVTYEWDGTKWIAPGGGGGGGGFPDPMTNAGDMIIRNSSNVTTRLGIGTAGQVLAANSAGDEIEYASTIGDGTF